MHVGKKRRLIWIRLANPDTSFTYVKAAPVRACSVFASLTSFAMPTFARRLLSILLTVLATSGSAFAQSAGWTEGFESDQISWREAGGDAAAQMLGHRRVCDGAHGGQSCEWIRLAIQGGSTYFFSQDIGSPRVIEELSPSVWVRANRAGVLFAARIVLPRSLDPRTGRPIQTLVLGTQYSDVGRWQRLCVNRIPQLLEKQIWSLRMQFGPNVNSQEAFVESVTLNVCCGAGETQVWIDDLEVAGHVSSHDATGSPIRLTAAAVPTNVASNASMNAAAGNAAPNYPTTGAPSNASGWIGSNSVGATPTVPPIDRENPPSHQIKFSGNILSVDGRPFFPRAIEYQGEPPALLKQLGFNAIWLKRMPAPELLEEAQRQGLWVICPPPHPTDGSPSSLEPIGSAFDTVLAWNLGEGLDADQLQNVSAWAKYVRSADRRADRPLIACPLGETREFSRLVDLLLIDKRPLGTSIELADYGKWVHRRPLVARPGTPVWTTVQTEAAEELRRQISALDPSGSASPCVTIEQMQLATYTAVAAGSRGLLFLSSTPLDGSDDVTKRRAASLRLLNLKIALIEPWGAAGNSAGNAEGNVREVVGSILRADRARLLMPIWFSPGSQCVPGQASANDLAMTAPGIPESSSAYAMIPGDLLPMKHRRVTGGMRVDFPEFDMTSQVLLAQDPVIVNSLIRRSELIGREAAQLQRDLALQKMNATMAVVQQSPRRAKDADRLATMINTARGDLVTCDKQLAVNEFSAASISSSRAMRALRVVERAFWDDATDGVASIVTSPALASFETLPVHWRMAEKIRASKIGANMLPGGDFEDVAVMMQSGWRHVKKTVPAVESAADLMPIAAKRGGMGLRLTVTPDEPKNPPAMLENAPVRFVSPDVNVSAGQIICFHGWINVPKSVVGSVDGVMIIDSLGGEALAERVGKTEGWKEFALYRIAPQTGPVHLEFALTGVGEAYVDDVEILPVDVGWTSAPR